MIDDGLRTAAPVNRKRNFHAGQFEIQTKGIVQGLGFELSGVPGTLKSSNSRRPAAIMDQSRRCIRSYRKSYKV